MQRLFLDNNGVRIEALFEDTGSDWCAVLAHPHSLMGGNMYNNVVASAWDACLSIGLSALRFNFRGVGSSGGSFDDGRGEMDDLACAAAYPGRPVVVVGYSFGAWVASRHAKRIDTPPPCILVSPPTSLFSFPDMRGDPAWVVSGGSDPFSSPHSLTGIVDADRITVVRSADHFWFGQEEVLSKVLAGLLGSIVG
ncbi:MAG TPA: alpha/beta hydrolase [Deltaproteobacteria bacterium]|nr:alpha/beta hydrolase [Deltaproteobacteria bacterium]HOM30150.1 alpha/beta hydrolase [Deltaproteobacteria bacterium]HPP80362.1 alpha/beta hydrolase [Deltaproteobacteria bacterium]